ncbi:DUF3560 domain-containing protein [Novosphingobium sp. YJ-S2-02]|uniref:DUF3560 domain-containing protein n=1 Tax=Novosphingobium aureum TaxID=2792964 RepID=A0A931HC08_9SPHN|nr:DUF3560 domain-containing protein [Novosphingobium aureum]MBH0113225.1 DUF3560 domain-containing protein [Novosphingobium aureum]
MTTFTATYSPEDNKLRLYASSRLDAETFARIKEAGFKWAPRQELFVAPKWTPAREDILVELAGEIEAEEMTLAERAAIKAERLDNLAHKRNREAQALHARADDLSQAFYMGQPILVGHHSERKARKTQERMQSAMTQAIKAEKASNYWLYRAEGVECFANMKNNPRVRANRIKTLLAELRDLQRGINAAHRALKVWEKATTDAQIKWTLGNLPSDETLASYGLYSAVCPFGDTAPTMEPAAARAQCIEAAELRINGPTRRRWIEHVLNRLAFERSMLGDVPRYSGELTPVILQAFARAHGAEKPACSIVDDGFYLLESPVPLPAHLSDNSWLELTGDEWRDVMQACGYEVPATKPRRTSSKPKPASLVNLSEAQAAQLQRIWNLHMVAACKRHQTPETNEVRAMDQARFSANSKGTYSPLSTVEIAADGTKVRGVWRGGEFVKSGEPVARIRICTAGSGFYKPSAVVRIVDKPCKPLPFDLDALEREAQAAADARIAENGRAAA